LRLDPWRASQFIDDAVANRDPEPGSAERKSLRSPLSLEDHVGGIPGAPNRIAMRLAPVTEFGIVGHTAIDKYTRRGYVSGDSETAPLLAARHLPARQRAPSGILPSKMSDPGGSCQTLAFMEVLIAARGKHNTRTAKWPCFLGEGLGNHR